jgi:hypothetical protein
VLAKLPKLEGNLPFPLGTRRKVLGWAPEGKWFSIPMTTSSDQTERRQSFRIKLQIRLFQRGSDDSGAEFIDLTKTLDIRTTGACVVTRRAPQIGRVVRITIPVSSEQGSGLIPAETPPIQARVRRAGEIGEAHTIGVEFLKPLE